MKNSAQEVSAFKMVRNHFVNLRKKKDTWREVMENNDNIFIRAYSLRSRQAERHSLRCHHQTLQANTLAQPPATCVLTCRFKPSADGSLRELLLIKNLVSLDKHTILHAQECIGRLDICPRVKKCRLSYNNGLGWTEQPCRFQRNGYLLICMRITSYNMRPIKDAI